MKERFSLIADIHLFLIRNESILLLKRKNTGYMDGYFHIPAGHLDGHERLIDALIRESNKEVGIVIAEKDVKLVHVMHHKSNNERLGFFFEVKKWQGEPENKESKKSSEVAWFALDNLPKNIIPYAKEAIKCYQKGMILSYYGWN